ncbi:MAG: 50S ribosomal protein L18 [Candidatus Micrarchaeota archaeon]
MAHKRTYIVKQRRRREGKTDRYKRLKTLGSGKARLVIRKTANNVVCQIVEYRPEGDFVLANSTALELKKYGYSGHCGNKKAGYLTGYICGKKAAAKKLKEAVADIGRATPVHGSVIFSCLKGAVDAGLEVAHSDAAFPEQKLLEGVESARAEIDKGLKPASKKPAKIEKKTKVKKVDAKIENKPEAKNLVKPEIKTIQKTVIKNSPFSKKGDEKSAGGKT